MGSRSRWIPGMGLLSQAWDATKLAGALKAHRQERALVLRKEQSEALSEYRGSNANKKVVEFFKDENYQEIARLYFPNFLVNKAKDLNAFFWKTWDIYWFFLLLRILLVFLPQSGYIHPDEFFQSVEVVTGDVLNLDVIHTWEFNITSPLRSMTLPYCIYATPLNALKFIDWISFNTLGNSAGLSQSTYFVFIIPRIVMLISSFLMDFTVYKVCILYKHNFNQCLTTLASSYVVLIYSTRTFSNSIEMVLVSFLIYLVAHCMKRTQETVFLQKMVDEKREKAESVAERVKLTKKMKKIPGHDFKYFGIISIICAIGVYNRPTFVAFAAIPLFFWFQRNIAINSYWTPFQTFNFRVASLIPGFFTCSLILLITDSLYYGELTLSKMWHLTMEWTDWKLTPLNFVMYNVVPGNLDAHGTHPIWFHTLVNLPLLYGPLGVVAIFSTVNFAAEIFLNEWVWKPGLRTIYAMTMFTFIVSVGALSIFPHQEPRFLIPITIPIILMNAHHLRYKLWNNRKPLLTLWYVFNIGMVFFYGFIHQGGVIPTVKYIGSDLSHRQNDVEINVLFSSTYMPPKFPLMKTKESGGKVHFYDLKGAEMEFVKEKSLALASRSNFIRHKKQTENYLVIPRHRYSELKLWTKNTLKFETIHTVFPHISTEHLPSFSIHSLLENPWSLLEKSPSKILTDIMESISDCSLVIYKFELFDDVKSTEYKETATPSSHKL